MAIGGLKKLRRGNIPEYADIQNLRNKIYNIIPTTTDIELPAILGLTQNGHIINDMTLEQELELRQKNGEIDEATVEKELGDNLLHLSSHASMTGQAQALKTSLELLQRKKTKYQKEVQEALDYLEASEELKKQNDKDKRFQDYGESNLLYQKFAQRQLEYLQQQQKAKKEKVINDINSVEFDPTDEGNVEIHKKALDFAEKIQNLKRTEEKKEENIELIKNLDNFILQNPQYKHIFYREKNDDTKDTVWELLELEEGIDTVKSHLEMFSKNVDNVVNNKEEVQKQFDEIDIVNTINEVSKNLLPAKKAIRILRKKDLLSPMIETTIKELDRQVKQRKNRILSSAPIMEKLTIDQMVYSAENGSVVEIKEVNDDIIIAEDSQGARVELAANGNFFEASDREVEAFDNRENYAEQGRELGNLARNMIFSSVSTLSKMMKEIEEFAESEKARLRGLFEKQKMSLNDYNTALGLLSNEVAYNRLKVKRHFSESIEQDFLLKDDVKSAKNKTLAMESSFDKENMSMEEIIKRQYINTFLKRAADILERYIEVSEDRDNIEIPSLPLHFYLSPDFEHPELSSLYHDMIEIINGMYYYNTDLKDVIKSLLRYTENLDLSEDGEIALLTIIKAAWNKHLEYYNEKNPKNKVSLLSENEISEIVNPVYIKWVREKNKRNSTASNNENTETKKTENKDSSAKDKSDVAIPPDNIPNADNTIDELKIPEEAKTTSDKNKPSNSSMRILQTKVITARNAGVITGTPKINFLPIEWELIEGRKQMKENASVNEDTYPILDWNNLHPDTEVTLILSGREVWGNINAKYIDYVYNSDLDRIDIAYRTFVSLINTILGKNIKTQ